MNSNQLKDVKLTAEILGSDFINNNFIHISGDNNLGNINISSNLTIGNGKTKFTREDYNELSNHINESGSNAKKIFTVLSSHLEQSLSNDINGVNCIALGGFATGDNSIAVGYLTRGTDKYDDRPFALGKSSIALGNLAKATDRGSTALGSGLASGQYSFAACGGNALSDTAFSIGGNAIGEKSFSHGSLTYAIGESSFAQNVQVSAIGKGSHAEGYMTQAIDQYSHAEGVRSIASCDSSHAEGYFCIASGVHSHAEGNNTIAGSVQSHAEGKSTRANGACSHAEGELTQANGTNSHSEGKSTIVNGHVSHAGGYQTQVDSNFTYAWSCGGEYVVNRANTFNINPEKKSSGFYIGETSLKQMLDNMIDKICEAAGITDINKIKNIKAQII